MKKPLETPLRGPPSRADRTSLQLTQVKSVSLEVSLPETNAKTEMYSTFL